MVEQQKNLLGGKATLNGDSKSTKKPDGSGTKFTGGVTRMPTMDRRDAPTTEIKKSDSKEDKPYTFTGEKIIGNGTFGVVFQARIVETGETVAIKKVLQDKRYKNRELQILQELNHQNVTTLKHAFYTQADGSDETYLNVVMDFVPENLYRVLKYYNKTKQPFPTILLKLYSYQMFRSLAYIHGCGICHRDIKPQNILVDPNSHIVKLCDFGSAKKLVKTEPSIAYICSRYYRAPELIFGSTEYNNTIDIWSTGCVIAELMLGEPLFAGESGIDQLVEIIKVLGTPTQEQVLKMNPKAEEYKFPNIKPLAWAKVFKRKVDPMAIDLVSKVLVYPPEERLKPLEALLHPFFNELRNASTKINDTPLPDLFNFSPEEIKTQPELISKLVPDWYKKKF